MSSHKNLKRKSKYYVKRKNKVRGTALFFNYIEGCENDVINLKKRLENLEWECIDVKVNRVNDFQEQNIKVSSKIMMVFFFGYGYDYGNGAMMFLGSSTKESISYEIFYQNMDEFQEKDDDDDDNNNNDDNDNYIILFTNICIKKPVATVIETRRYVEYLGNIHHFCTEINGTCEKKGGGSLMTHILLNEIKKDLPFDKMARELSNKIDNISNWNEDEYHSYWLYRTAKIITVPSLACET